MVIVHVKTIGSMNQLMILQEYKSGICYIGYFEKCTSFLVAGSGERIGNVISLYLFLGT